MAAQADIPLRFPEEPKAQRRELERMASSISTYFSGITGHPHAGVVPRRYTKRPLNDTKAAFWQMTPVSLPDDDAEHTVSLPPPDPRNAGLKTIVSRATTTGTVYLSAPHPSLINGQRVVALTNEISFVEVLFDGENYLTQPGMTAWEA